MATSRARGDNPPRPPHPTPAAPEAVAAASSSPSPHSLDVVLQPWSQTTSSWMSPPNRPLVLDVMSHSWRPQATTDASCDEGSSARSHPE